MQQRVGQPSAAASQPRRAQRSVALLLVALAMALAPNARAEEGAEANAEPEFSIRITDFAMGRMRTRSGTSTGSHLIDPNYELQVRERTSRIPLQVDEIFGIELTIDATGGRHLLFESELIPASRAGDEAPPPSHRRLYYTGVPKTLSMGWTIDSTALSRPGTWTVRFRLRRVDQQRQDDAALRVPNVDVLLFERRFELQPPAGSPAPVAGSTAG